ncbi:MAG: peptidoglycan-binding protein, partial [Parasphingopyxis sp.]
MIDDRAIQRFLAEKGTYTAAVDGDYGPKSRTAARDALVAAGYNVEDWPDSRCKIAVQQMLMAEAGIEAGTIDGLVGPQTRFAWEAWQNRQRDAEPTDDDIAHQPPVWPRQKDVA